MNAKQIVAAAARRAESNILGGFSEHGSVDVASLIQEQFAWVEGLIETIYNLDDLQCNAKDNCPNIAAWFVGSVLGDDAWTCDTHLKLETVEFYEDDKRRALLNALAAIPKGEGKDD